MPGGLSMSQQEPEETASHVSDMSKPCEMKCDCGFNNIDLIFLLSHPKEFKDLGILHVFRYSKNS